MKRSLQHLHSPTIAMNTMKSVLFTLIVLFSFSLTTIAQKIDEKRIKSHIKILASDSMKGRETGTEGERMALAYISKQFSALKLTPKGVSGFEQSFPFKSGVHGTGETGTAHNVVAYLDNKADKTIIIGAHYDHLGEGASGNSLDANPTGKIHNGADDNASGVAGVLELARYFKTNNVKEKSNFLFICFSGEELGLYGSKYFTENPTIELSKASYMINMDMIGRLDPNTKSISVSGTGTSTVWEPLLKSVNSSLTIKTDSSGMGPSDHSSFYLKNMPVLHFFTGSHSDYHKPTDDWDKINYTGQKEVLDLIITVIEKLDAEPKLSFLATKNKTMGSSRSSFKVTLGVMPSYTASEPGLLIDGVTDGKPAQLAGIQAGDLIIKIGDVDITDIQTYMGALGKFEKGQKVPVKVKRKAEVLELDVTF